MPLIQFLASLSERNMPYESTERILSIRRRIRFQGSASGCIDAYVRRRRRGKNAHNKERSSSIWGRKRSPLVASVCALRKCGKHNYPKGISQRNPLRMQWRLFVLGLRGMRVYQIYRRQRTCRYNGKICDVRAFGKRRKWKVCFSVQNRL